MREPMMREPMYRIYYKTSEFVGQWFGGTIPELDKDLDGIVKRIVNFAPETKVERIVEVSSGKVVWPVAKEVPLTSYDSDGRHVIGTAKVYSDGRVEGTVTDAEKTIPGLVMGYSLPKDPEKYDDIATSEHS